MISLLRGKIAALNFNLATVDVQGVGYEVYCSKKCLEKLVLNKEETLTIYTEVREDSIRLFGFEDGLEKQVFLLLTTVKGVGARTACEIISWMDKLELLKAIGAGSLTRLQSVKGIGKKTAERIIVELKDKVAEFAFEQRGTSFSIETEIHGPVDEAIEALVVLGFPRADAERAVKQVEKQGGVSSIDSGSLVREALRFV